LHRLTLALLLVLGGCLAVFAQPGKPHPITQQALELRLETLERNRAQAIANVNAYDGAIQECKYWLELLKKAEKKERAKEEKPAPVVTKKK